MVVLSFNKLPSGLLEKRDIVMTRRKTNTKVRNVIASTKSENKGKGNTMNWVTLLIAIFGAFGGLASVKMIVDHFTPCKIEGKIISRYYCIKNDRTGFLMLFKISIFYKNKPFNLRNIKCELEDIKGNEYSAYAKNLRYVDFPRKKTQEIIKEKEGREQAQYVNHRLLVSGDEFLNNYSFFPKNQNITGYLYFEFLSTDTTGDISSNVKSTTFIFEPFEGKHRKFIVQEADFKEGDLFDDDSIWEPVETK